MNGFCPYLLAHLRAIAQCNLPSAKITPAGFLRALLENRPNVTIINSEQALKLDDGSGHIRDLVLKYRKRAVPQNTSTVDNCEVDVQPQYSETTVTATKFRKLAIFMEDEDLARYCADATNMIRVNGMPTPFMQDFMDGLMEQANGLLGAIDIDLLALQAANFGVNVVTGSNAARTINFPQNTTINNLDSGMTRLLQDAIENEVCGDLILVGSGLMSNYNIQQQAACCANNGVDTSRFQQFRFYNDLYAKQQWGENHVGAFSRGSVGFVELNRYQGFRAGQKGTSTFFTMPLPVECPECYGGYDNLVFDAQLRYLDCPTTINVGCEGEKSVGRGWILDLSKSFGLFNIPTNAYQGTNYDDCYNDRLLGNNGTLRFVITNS